MEHLVYFNNWEGNLFEADLSKHYNHRKFERIEKLAGIEIPPNLIDEIIEELDITYIEFENKIVERLKIEILERLEKIENIEFQSDTRIAYPVMKAVLKFKDKKFPINMVMESMTINKRGRKAYQKHIGDQIYVVINHNKLITIEVFQSLMSHDDIVDYINKNKSAKKFDTGKIKMIPPNDKFEYNIIIHAGELVDKYEKPTTEVNYTISQQYSLRKGRKLKVYVKFKDEFIEGTSEGILNNESYKTDKGIKVALEMNIDGSKRKLPKLLGPDEKLYLPIGPNDEWILCKVLDPFYIIEKRSEEPLQLRYQAIKE